MARPNLLSRAVAALSGRPTADTIRTRLAAAEATAAEATVEWRKAAVAVEAGAEPSIEVEAEAKLRAARAAVDRLRAVLSEVEAADASDARADRDARQDALNAATVDAYAKLPQAARAVEEAAKAYVSAWQGLLDAGDAAQAAASVNHATPRHHLLSGGAAGLVALELARVSPEGRPLPPGPDAWAAAARDRRTITPLAAHFEGIAAAVRESLASGR